MLITSMSNEKIKYYKKLQERKYRKLYNQFLIEGEHLVMEAFNKNIIEEIILIEDIKELVNNNIKKVFVTKEIMRKISSLNNPPNIIALCNILDNEITGNKYLLLDNIQDPGNLGTIIRTAAAFNIDTIVLSNDTVDLYNPKVIRATQGMFLNVNIVRRDLFEIINELKEKNILIYGTKVDGGNELKTLKLNKDKYALIMGNEGEGIKKEIFTLCDELIYVKINNRVESLNVGIAAGIILYEFSN